MKKSKALVSGAVLFVVGMAIIVLQKITDWGISTFLGKLYCGERYLQPVGQPGDGMCGFNMDMVVGMGSFLLIVAGVILVIVGVIKIIAKRKKK